MPDGSNLREKGISFGTEFHGKESMVTFMAAGGAPVGGGRSLR